MSTLDKRRLAIAFSLLSGRKVRACQSECRDALSFTVRRANELLDDLHQDGPSDVRPGARRRQEEQRRQAYKTHVTDLRTATKTLIATPSGAAQVCEKIDKLVTWRIDRQAKTSAYDFIIGGSKPVKLGDIWHDELEAYRKEGALTAALCRKLQSRGTPAKPMRVRDLITEPELRKAIQDAATIARAEFFLNKDLSMATLLYSALGAGLINDDEFEILKTAIANGIGPTA